MNDIVSRRENLTLNKELKNNLSSISKEKKIKYFDLSQGQFIPATKLYIHYDTYEIESQKTNHNFEVDTLIANSISQLAKKGYKTISSNSGHVYHYFLNKWSYFQDSLLTDNNHHQYMFLEYSGGLPVKYELVSQDSDDFLEYQSQHPQILLKNTYDISVGIFRVTIPIVKVEIVFDKKYNFPTLPNKFRTDGNSIVSKIYYDFDTLNLDKLQLEIIKINKEILDWVKHLPKAF